MKTQQIVAELNECLQNADIAGTDENLDLLLENASEEDACKELAQLIGNHYTQYKSDALSKVLEMIIRKNSNLVLSDHPNNFLFQMIIRTGSFEMYECFIDEAVTSYLSAVPVDERELYYLDLSTTAQELSEKLFLENKKCIKGRHYNGAFSQNGNAVLLNEQDYLIMEDVMELYNVLVGRRDIILDLNKKGGL